MNKTLLWIGSLLWLLMLGTAEANDFNTYRYITEDGTALNITDTAYTKVAESTIAGTSIYISLV